jgi:methylenetetrahydrofolate dehydrogenase (NADP+)/methenyltetrahydrofolate cyclohydrolase
MIIDGKIIANKILFEVKQAVAQLSFQPIFCDVLVGEDLASKQYVEMKAKKAEACGIRFLQANFASEISTEALLHEIKQLNATENLCGLILQLPLPQHIHTQQVLDAVSYSIDVECLSAKRLNDFYAGDLSIVPPTAGAILEIFKELKIDLNTKNILILGQGKLVGKPLTYLLSSQGITVNTATRETHNTPVLLKQADVIISAVGKPNLITASQIKPHCIVIDAGTSEDYGTIVGDVNFAEVVEVAQVISPVPGGVGPITVAKLLQNVIQVAKLKVNENRK